MSSALSLYTRLVVVVEGEKVRPGERARQARRTKQLDLTVAQLALAGVRVLYSSGQEETAALLASLVQGEASKGLSLPRALRLSPWQEELVTWLLLSPGLSLGAALTLATSFPSLREVVLAPPALLQQRGGISPALAARLAGFWSHGFRHQLTDMAPL